jgi:phosphatidylglycerophosphate synthase
MRLDVTPLVGNSAARAVHGHSAGADVVLVGAAASVSLQVAGPNAVAAGSAHRAGLVESLAEVVPGARFHEPTGAALTALADVAELASDRALVVGAGGLEISPVALLDLLDRPGNPTAVATLDVTDLDTPVVQGGPGRLTPVRTHPARRDVLSVGTTRHTVTAPTALAVGVLRIAGADRATAASLWRAAADSTSARNPDIDAFDLSLLALVRGGLRVGSVALGPFTVDRDGATVTGAPGSPWQQRLRGASRGGDGFFSTYAVRPLSRRTTGVGLRLGWSPNAVTVASLALGAVATALTAIDNRWCWAVAGVLLLAALVVDCVDGEIARFTRRFSALGAWLDAVGDRIKEYSLIAAVAWVAARRGESAWGLAATAMVLITLRHLEDYAYVHRQRASIDGVRPDRLDIDAPRDLGPVDAPLDLPRPRTGRARVVFWTKKVVHLPIAERYLLLALGLLTFDPHLLLGGMVVAVTAAMVWTLGGRTAKALLHRDGYRPESVPPTGWGHLDHQLDLGALTRALWRAGSLPFPLSLVGVGLAIVAALAAGSLAAPPVVIAVVVGVLLAGAGCRPPLRHVLGWQAPLLLWLVEASVVLGLSNAAGEVGGAVFAYLAAVAWHRYDVVYRLRDTGAPAAAWVTPWTLGIDGRVIVLTLLWAASVPLSPLLAWGGLVLFLVYAAESALGWRAWVRAADGAPSSEGDAPKEVVEG